jgi:hypothetical protein
VVYFCKLLFGFFKCKNQRVDRIIFNGQILIALLHRKEVNVDGQLQAGRAGIAIVIWQ